MASRWQFTFGPAVQAFRRDAFRLGLTLAIVGVLLLLCVWTTYESWKATRQQALQHERNVVLAIEGEISQAIMVFDHALQSTVVGMAIPGLAEMDQQVRQAILFNAGGGIKAAEGMLVADEVGQVIYNSFGTAPLNLNLFDRPLFQLHRQNATMGLTFSPPLHSLIDESWIIGFSRRINRPDGSFAGVAFGRISLTFLQSVINKFNVGKNSVITLSSSEGRLLARNPIRPNDIGRDLSNTALLRSLKNSSSGIAELVASIDGINRLYTYQRLPGLPFMVAVGFSTAEIFKDWVRKSILLCSVMALLLLVGAGSALVLRRQLQHRRRAELRELATAFESQARLEQLSQHLAENRDQAVQANAAKSRFITGVTHELRTPLNGILGYAQLLGIEGELTPIQRYRVKAMQAAGEHLLGMINAVLDLSQIDSDCIELQASEVDLRLTVRACFDLLAPEAQGKGLALSTSIAPSVPGQVVMDPIRLRQVLVNLLGNAVKFTPAGTIEVRLLPGRAASRIKVEVVDTGPGIKADQRHKLFKEFERLDVTARVTEGAGLGLAITARLVERMGGEVGYVDNPGGGSIFWIELPYAGVADGGVRLQEEPSGRGPGRLRVLIVDDVAMNSEIATTFLRLAGHDARSVDNGPAAIEAVIANEFDVVLMDVRMPGMDGLEATRRIRALPTERSLVPIVALTAQAFAEQIEKCRAAGMDDHVAKPFQRDTLLKSVSNAALFRSAARAGPASTRQTEDRFVM